MGCLEIGAASWIGDWMLAVEQPQPVFAGSYAFPDLQSAARWLGVQAQPPLAVDDALWLEFARQTQQRLDVHFALVTGCYPSKRQIAATHAPFEIVCAIAAGEHAFIHRQSMGGHPDVLGSRIAKTGLDQVRRALLGLLPVGHSPANQERPA